MATPFADIYDLVRAATGNEDPDIGSVVLPDARIDVLLRTSILTFRSYSESLPEMSYTKVDGAYTASISASPELAVNNNILGALAHAAAHKYFVGIGNRVGISESLGALAAFVDLYAGHALSEVNEVRLESYQRLRNQAMQANLTNF